MDEDSRGKRLLMAALNKNTKDNFAERVTKSSVARKKKDDDVDYIPELQSASDSDESQDYLSSSLTEENVLEKGSQSLSESANNVDGMVASLEDSVLTEFQPLAPDMPHTRSRPR